MKTTKTPSSVFIYDAFNGKHTKDKIGYAISSNLEGRKSEYRRNAWDNFDVIAEIPWNDTWFELGEKGKKVFMRNTVQGKKVAPDQFLHKLIETLGWGTRWVNYSQKKTPEVFSLSVENPFEFLKSAVLRCIQLNWDFDQIELEFRKNQNTLIFTPRPIQAWALAKYFDLKAQSTKSSLNVIEDLCARFGKTLYSLEKFNRLNKEHGVNLFVVVSSWLSSHKSFETDYKKFFGSFGHFRFVDWTDADFTDKVESYLGQGHPVIVTVSIHEAPRKWERQMKVVEKHPAKKKYMFIDEADFATTSKIKRDKIEALANGCDITRASGTGIKKLAAGFERIDGIISCSYFELLNASKKTSKIFLKDYLMELDPVKNRLELALCEEIQSPGGLVKYSAAADVVGVDFYRITPRCDFFDNLSYFGFSQDDYPTWSKPCLFASTHASLLRYFVGGLFGIGKMGRFSLWGMGNFDHLGVMGFTACQEKAQLIELSTIIQGFLPDIIVGYICGENTTNREAEDYVKSIAGRVKNEDKKGYFILTMDMGSRSFSVSSLTHVLLMFDGGGIDPTKQKISRALTPGLLLNGEKKVSGIIVELSFDPNREEASIVDQLILDEVLNNKTEKETTEQAFKRNFYSHDCVNFFKNDDVNVNKLDFSQYWNEINHDTNLIQKVGVASINVGLTLSDASALSIYLRVKGTDAKLMDTVPMGKTRERQGEAILKNKTKKQKCEEKKILKLVEQARDTIFKSPLNLAAIYSEVSTYPLSDMVDDKSVRKHYIEIVDFLSKSSIGSSLVQEEIGITPTEIKKLIDGKHINADFLDIVLSSVLESIRKERIIS